MNIDTGEIKDLRNIPENDLERFVKILEKEMTAKQKEERKVSLHDHRSKLGKKLTAERKKRYSEMTRNQKRNLRKKGIIK